MILDNGISIEHAWGMSIHMTIMTIDYYYRLPKIKRSLASLYNAAHYLQLSARHYACA